MTKAMFMIELESLLGDISSEERDNALRYYEDYFADAGVEKESDIIAELGSPKRVAEIILLELNNGMRMNELDGIYTENGYKNTKYGDDKYEVLNATKTIDHNDNFKNDNESVVEDLNSSNHHNQSEYSYDKREDFNNNQNYRDTQDFNNQDYFGSKEYYQDNSNGNYYNPYGKRDESTGKRKNTWLIILLGIFALPIGLPLLITAFALVFAVAMVVLSLFIAIYALSIGLFVGGIVTVVAGIVTLITVPINGIYISGIGLILLGLGIIFGIISIHITKAIVPGFIRGIVSILSRPFQRRRVVA
jgi:uncharacterized membrane protein